MKKLIIILAAVLSINAASAQHRNGNYTNYNSYATTQTGADWNKNSRGSDQSYYDNQKRHDQYNRDEAYRSDNGSYDQRANGYRNERSGNVYEKQRQINYSEPQRQEKKLSFGTGLVVGGIAALLIGAIISH